MYACNMHTPRSRYYVQNTDRSNKFNSKFGGTRGGVERSERKCSGGRARDI